MPRFVLLYHDCSANYERPSHWDLMFETAGVLRTWALAKLPRHWQTAHDRTRASYADCPSLAERNTVAATRLADHRSDYIHLEGPLSRDRGTVIRVASGVYQADIESPDGWRVRIEGSELSAWVTLTCAESAEWILEC